jgi:hypothetical protein
MRRIPEIDLLNLIDAYQHGVLEEKAAAYVKQRPPSWNYEPVRSSVLEACGVATPLFGKELARPSLDQLVNLVGSRCKKGVEQIAANVEAVAALYRYVDDSGLHGVKLFMGEYAIGCGGVVRCWSDLILYGKDGPFIPYFDWRRSNGIVSATALKAAFSLQHIGVRKRFGQDLGEAKLAVIGFPARKNKPRSARVRFYEGGELFSEEELLQAVIAVYEAVASARHAATFVPMKRQGDFGF